MLLYKKGKEVAITYPTNLLADISGIGWSTEFNLLYRQEQSRHASGRTRVKDFGTPIWSATYTTKNLSPNNIDFWKAKLNALENGLNTFIAYPTSRCWPIAHPGGVAVDETGWVLESGFWNDAGIWLGGVPWNDTIVTTGLVDVININNKALSIKNIPYLNLSIGDFLSIDNNLYQVMEDAESATIAGITPQFEVRPHLSSSISVNDVVLINKPSCLMTLVPGSVSASSGLNGRGSISFQAIESRG